MVNRDIIAAKLAELSDRIERVRQRCPATVEALAPNRDVMDIVAFNLMLAVQICADVASHVIADEGWPGARTLAESFTRLQEHGVISGTTGAALSRAVGLRNVVAHGYAGADPAMVHTAGTRGVADLESFAREVATWVTSSPGGQGIV